MSKEPKAAKAEEPPKAPDPAVLLQDAGVRSADAPVVTLARADGGVWIDLRAERDRARMLEQLFNAALDRAPDSTKSLIDQSTATPKITRVKEAARRMADRLAKSGFEIVRRV